MVYRPQVGTAQARLRLADGMVVAVPPGGVVGRGPAALARVLHPGVSEAHAMVVRAGDGLRLLSLRGTLHVDGEPFDEVDLQPGMEIVLCVGVGVTVVDVEVPKEVLAVRVGGEEPVPLRGSLYSVLGPPDPQLAAGLVDGSLGTVFSAGAQWWLAATGGAPRGLRPGDDVALGKVRLVVELLDLPAQELRQRTSRTGLAAPLTLVARYSSVHVFRHRRLPVVIDALPGRLLSEVATIGVPVGWEVVARELWPDFDDYRLRMSWDRALRRLRSELQVHGIRGDLVRPDGRGNVELFLLPGDNVRDET